MEIGNIKGEGLTSEKRKMTGGVGLYISQLFGGNKKKTGQEYISLQRKRTGLKLKGQKTEGRLRCNEGTGR